MRELAEVVTGAGLTGLVCLNLGELTLILLRVRLTGLEWKFFGFLVGAALLSLTLFVACSLQVVYWPVLAGLAVGAIVLRYRVRESRLPPETDSPPLPRVWAAAFCCVYLIFGVYYFVTALLPEMSPDGAAYHLGFVRRYYENHGFTAVRTNMYANFPFGVEMLFLYAYAFGRHSAAALVHLLFLLVLPFGMIAYAKREGRPAAGVLGGLLVFASPLMGRDGTSAYVDAALAATIFGSFAAIQLWVKRQERGLLWIGAMLAGFACATKYTALPVVLYALGVVCHTHFRNRRRAWPDLAVVTAVAGVMILPWLAKNAIFTGNPVYPFLNQFFPSPYFYGSVEREWQSNLAHMNGVSWPEIPLEATVRGYRLSGLVGPVFLLAPLALAGLRWRAGRQLLLMFVACGLPYFSNIGARFLLPCLPFLSLLLGWVCTSVPGVGLAVVAAHAVLSWPGVVERYAHRYAWQLGAVDWRAALRLTPESEYLSKRLGDYRMGLELNRRVAPGARVFSTSFGLQAYHDREIVDGYTSALGSRTFDMLASALFADRMPTWRRRMKFERVPVRGIRVVASGAGPVDWQINELRLFDGEKELPRNDRWRLDAAANRWELPLAFDNSAASRWRSGRNLEPGLYVEVEFPEAVNLDGVELTAGAAQKNHPLEVWVEQAGHWQKVYTQEESRVVPLPLQYRRVVMREIRASGVDWLLLREEDYGGSEVLNHPEAWGVTHVTALDGYHLLRIDPSGEPPR
ncbi:ArnT family glycosyltransferase [Paludibaculum fermentans]|uniref:DUF8201 domain-containing protein n=1 Tax=Paludibaculum fermentans TaxID=1473598 RepID=A0A7S7NT19_PALFE|nr:hypothetical protein [Paludibaculum fermentans]QOY89186.1 hypothetical protein IRI77_04290 [Paludibaculum fermentans]